MIFKYQYQNGLLTIDYISQNTDTLQYNDSKGNTIKLLHKTIEIYLPISIVNIHQDLIAISCYLLTFPFLGSNIIFQFSISKTLQVYFESNGYSVTHNSEIVLPLKPKSGKTYPGISFSGGYDSMASLLLLPQNTRVIFLDRFEFGNSHYKKDKVYLLLEELKSKYKVFVIKTNLEKIRNPTGFVTDWASGIPAILLSEYLKLDSIAYGYILHHIIQIEKKLPILCTGQTKYIMSSDDLVTPSSKNKYYNVWQNLFKCVDLEICLPVIGMTEILTKNIVHKSPYYKYTSSCIRGDSQNDCGQCLKCFKHLLLENLLYNNNINEIQLRQTLEKIGNIVNKEKYKCDLSSLEKIGSLEVFLLYFTHYYRGTNENMLKIRNTLMKHRDKVYYTTYWNSNSLKYVPSQYQEYLQLKINYYLYQDSKIPKKFIPKITPTFPLKKSSYSKKILVNTSEKIVPKLTDYFDYTYIINLRRRDDRWKKMKQRMQKLEIDSKKWGRFEAVDSKEPTLQKLFHSKQGWFETHGALALLYSVIGVLLDALKKGYEKILILEDDVIFHRHFSKLFAEKIPKIPKKWKLFYLGTSCHSWRISSRFKHFKEYVHSSGTIPGAFSVGIHRSIIPILIQLLKTSREPWDIGPLKYINKHYHSQCFIMYPYLTIADVTDSDIRKSKSMQEKARKCKWNLEDYNL